MPQLFNNTPGAIGRLTALAGYPTHPGALRQRRYWHQDFTFALQFSKYSIDLFRKGTTLHIIHYISISNFQPVCLNLK